MGLSFFGSLHAQSLNECARLVDAQLELKRTELVGASVVIEYEIPYSGMVEIRLYDKQGNKVWQNFGVREKGEHYQALRVDKLEPGVQYQFEFWYKGKPYKGKFSV